MSVLAAIFLAQAAAAAPAPAPAPREVDPAVVEQLRIIGAKLQDWRGAWGVADGKLGCKTVTSTGDEEIDFIGCAALVTCIKPILPDLKKIADGKQAADEKERLMKARLGTQSQCLTEIRGSGIAKLALVRGTKK